MVELTIKHRMEGKPDFAEVSYIQREDQDVVRATYHGYENKPVIFSGDILLGLDSAVEILRKAARKINNGVEAVIGIGDRDFSQNRFFADYHDLVRESDTQLGLYAHFADIEFIGGQDVEFTEICPGVRTSKLTPVSLRNIEQFSIYPVNNVDMYHAVTEILLQPLLGIKPFIGVSQDMLKPLIEEIIQRGVQKQNGQER
jgi:hypothetical protein